MIDLVVKQKKISDENKKVIDTFIKKNKIADVELVLLWHEKNHNRHVDKNTIDPFRW